MEKYPNLPTSSKTITMNTYSLHRLFHCQMLHVFSLCLSLWMFVSLYMCDLNKNIRTHIKSLEADNYAKSSWNSVFCDLDCGIILDALLKYLLENAGMPPLFKWAQLGHPFPQNCDRREPFSPWVWDGDCFAELLFERNSKFIDTRGSQ